MNAPLSTIGLVSDSEALIDEFAQSPRSLADLARAHRMTIPAMLAWAKSPANQRTLRAIRDLTDARTDLVVSSARSEAAHALRRLAVESDSAETQRKACVDLLRLGLPPAPARAKGAKDGGASGPVPDAGPDPDGLRRVLDAVAEHAEREDADGEIAGGETDRAPEHAA